jgi:hypothetical protein
MDSLSKGIYVDYGVFDRISKTSEQPEEKIPHWALNTNAGQDTSLSRNEKTTGWPQAIRSIRFDESYFTKQSKPS